MIFWNQIKNVSDDDVKRKKHFNDFIGKMCTEVESKPKSPSSVIILADMVLILLLESEDSILFDTLNNLDPALQESFYGKRSLKWITWYENSKKGNY
jgi:hypothetical protein